MLVILPVHATAATGAGRVGHHKSESARLALAVRRCEPLFLPSYSPDCTPIEQTFSNVKAFLRSLGACTQEALQEAARLAIEAIPRRWGHLVCSCRIPTLCSTHLGVALTSATEDEPDG